MSRGKPLTVISYQEVKDPETGEIKIVRLEDLTPEQAKYYRKLRADRLIAACQKILQRHPELIPQVCIIERTQNN